MRRELNRALSLRMQLQKTFHAARAPSRLLALMKRDPARFDLRLKPVFQGTRNVQVHAHKVHIVQSLIVMEPSFFAHIRIFVFCCYAEHYDAPMMMVFENLVELFDGPYCDDLVGFVRLGGCLGVVMAVCFGQGECVRY